MPRIARGLLNGGIFHVLNRGNHRQMLFWRDEEFAAFLDLLSGSVAKFTVKLWGYCLMGNHWHLVAGLQRQGSVKNGTKISGFWDVFRLPCYPLLGYKRAWPPPPPSSSLSARCSSVVPPPGRRAASLEDLHALCGHLFNGKLLEAADRGVNSRERLFGARTTSGRSSPRS